MKSKKQAILVTVLLLIAIVLGICDGIYNFTPYINSGSQENSSESDYEDMIESGSEAIEKVFKWHVFFKYPEWWILDTLLDKDVSTPLETSDLSD